MRFSLDFRTGLRIKSSVYSATNLNLASHDAQKLMSDGANASFRCSSDQSNRTGRKIFQAGNFQPDVFWLACNFTQREKIPQSVLQRIFVQTTITEQDEKGKYVQKSVPVREFISSFTEFHYMDLRNFEPFIGNNEIGYAAICEALDQAGVDELKIPVEQSHSLWTETIQILKTSKPLLLYKVTAKEGSLLKVKKDEKVVLLKGPWRV